MVTRGAVGGWRMIGLIVLLATTVFAYSVATKPSNGGGNVVSVSDTYNYAEVQGGGNKAPSWIGIVQVLVVHNGMLVYDTLQHNTITNTGEAIISACTARGATSAPACAMATNGLGRSLGTFSPVTTNSHKISYTFTNTGTTPVTITKVCMFDAASGGSLFAEDVLSNTASVAPNDQITINWTFTH
ncbi:MAG: hypothetical protein E6K84_01135 [Thaumarchaeota archaeon]|nr:MAG: hypothetical protein E6K84_01135 [Nitrososphaerota archaeon]